MDLNKLKTLDQAEAIKVAAEYAGVAPEVLDRMWTKESGRGKNMLSPKGAMGHFQQMPKTLATMRERHGAELDPNDFYDGLFMAGQIMKENMAASKGNVADALRRYNSGWKPELWDNPETNDYVETILGPGTGTPPDRVDDVKLLVGRAADVREQMRNDRPSTTKEHIPAIDKALMQDAAANAAATAIAAGGTDAEALDHVLYTRSQVDTEAARTAANTVPAPQVSNAPAVAVGDAAYDITKKQAQDAIGVLDKARATFDNMDTVRIVKALGRESYAIDPKFNYMGNIDDIERGFVGTELDQLREARSAQHLADIKKEILAERQRVATLFSGSAAGGFMWTLAGGVADPAGWAAGLGVGKAFQLAGVGSRALAQSGRAAAAGAAFTGEAVIGNVLLDATRDVAGDTVTLNDYAMSAGAGLVMGGIMAPWALRGSYQQSAQARFQRIEREAADAEHALWLAAQKRAGADATQEEIRQAANAIQVEEVESLLRTSLADVPGSDQILARVDMDATLRPVSTPDDIARLGIDATVSDPVSQSMIAEMIVRAERFVKQNSLENVDTKSVVLDAVGMESTAAQLLRSKSPLAKMVGATLLESTTGAGGRRRTAALSAHMREQQYVGNVLHDYESAYLLFRNERRGGAWEDAWSGRNRAEFDRAVAMEREARRSGLYETTPHPSVRRAADTLDRGYDRMRIEQQHVGTVGASRLGSTSRGYMPHQMSAARVLAMDADELRIVQGVMSRQFQARLEFDEAFSNELAVKYTERMRQRAQGTHTSPVNLTNPYAADMIEDSLRALNVPPDRIAEAMGRFSRGGAGHTKQRLDLDLNEEFIKADGTPMRLIDLFDTDQMGLYRSYARRTSSEVALAQYGIMGQNGMKLLRNGMEVNGASIKELEAFDQIAAEFFNQPFGSATPAWMDNARTLVSQSRLGGMGFTQMGEYANGLGALGIMRTFKAIGALPRMLKEVSALKRGELPTNPILNSLERVGSEIGGEPYKMIGLYDVADNAVQQYGRESVGFASRAIRAGGNMHARLSFHRAITTAQTRGMAEQIVHKATKFIRDGKEDAALADMGVTPELAKALKKDLKNIARFDKEGNLVQFDITKASNPQAAAEFVQAVRRGSAQIIQNTFIGETGKWAHSGFLKMLTQFRTFSLTAVEKQWGRQAAVHGAAKAAGFLVGAMSFAAPIHLLRVAAGAVGLGDAEREQYLERRLSPYAFAQATLNYTSTSGLLSDVLNFAPGVVDTFTGGAASESMGRNPRGAGGGIVEQVVPAVGWANDAFSGDPHKTLKALPFSNLPYIQPFLNLIK